MSARRQSRQRGNIAMLLAIILPMLLGVGALVIDLGHGWQVRNQQQNAVDSAALAGVRDLDGTSGKFNTAIASAVYYAGLNSANNAQVSVPSANVVVGHWDFSARTFAPYAGTMSAYLVNAVKVTAPVLPVSTWFAPILGIDSENVQTSAIAVGGSPSQTCGFPLAVPDCAIIDDNGQLLCNSSLTFGRATTDNVGFTLLTSNPPVDTPGIDCELGCALVGHSVAKGNGGKCNCSNSCNSTAIASGQIYISNGNNLSSEDVVAINQAVQNNPNGIYVQVPVLNSNGLTKASCGSFQFNRDQTISGYVEMKLVSASDGGKNGPKTITISVDCSRTGSQSPNGSGGFFGYKSTNVYLVK